MPRPKRFECREDDEKQKATFDNLLNVQRHVFRALIYQNRGLNFNVQTGKPCVLDVNAHCLSQKNRFGPGPGFVTPPALVSPGQLCSSSPTTAPPPHCYSVNERKKGKVLPKLPEVCSEEPLDLPDDPIQIQELFASIGSGFTLDSLDCLPKDEKGWDDLLGVPPLSTKK